MTQLDMLEWKPAPTATTTERPTIEQRWASWSIANGHVLVELLRLAREHINRGAKFVSVKKLWEECRVSLSASKDGGHKLNNDFTAAAARWLIDQEPRLAGVMKTRRRTAP